MKYELAKKLKDAGLPQNGPRFSPPGGLVGESEVTYPTLSELIAACGDDVEALIRQSSLEGATWGAVSSIEGYMTGSGVYVGDTPEEAVANLWLALHGPAR